MLIRRLNLQQVFDGGKLSGRTLRAIGKQAYGSIVHNSSTAIDTHLYRIVRILYCLGRVLIRDIALEPFVFCHLPLLSMVLKV
jgi:hypothetical protein